VLGFIMRRHGVPVAPLLIGMVLGPLAETNLRDGLLSSNGDYSIFVTGPIPLVLYGLLFIVLALTVRSKIVNRARQDV
jgi:putative tricarboxylic transport membrane protein